MPIKEKSTLEQKLFKGIKNVSAFFLSWYDKNNVDYDQLQNELEQVLIQFDFPASLSMHVADNVIRELKATKIKAQNDVKKIIEAELLKIYGENNKNVNFLNVLEKDEKKISVIFVCGSNGVGKTTAIAKIANFYKKKDYKVLLVAGDTFRAGAVEQIKQWADKLKIDIVVPAKEKEDPASLIYKAAMKKDDYDLIICDTSGRQHNNQNLMQEIQKLHTVIQKFNPDAPHESLLVLDATHGQSAFLQAESFLKSAKISGIILNKMDNSTKGGMIFAIKNKYNIPVKLIGVGEELEDIYPFNIEIIVKKIADLMLLNWKN